MTTWNHVNSAMMQRLLLSMMKDIFKGKHPNIKNKKLVMLRLVIGFELLQKQPGLCHEATSHQSKNALKEVAQDLRRYFQMSDEKDIFNAWVLRVTEISLLHRRHPGNVKMLTRATVRQYSVLHEKYQQEVKDAMTLYPTLGTGLLMSILAGLKYVKPSTASLSITTVWLVCYAVTHLCYSPRETKSEEVAEQTTKLLQFINRETPLIQHGESTAASVPMSKLK